MEPTSVIWNVDQITGFAENGYVLGGIDCVQYSLNNVSKPVIGTKDLNNNFKYTAIYLTGNFSFVSQQNLDIFLSDPGRYSPRFGGYGITIYISI